MDTKTLTQSLEEVKAWSEGSRTLKVTSIVPPHIDVKRVRTELGLSQPKFAAKFGFRVGAIRNWEQGLREPEGPTRTLLALIERNPEMISKEIEKLRVAV